MTIIIPSHVRKAYFINIMGWDYELGIQAFDFIRDLREEYCRWFVRTRTMGIGPGF